MTHAYLHNLASIKPALFSQKRLIYATKSSSGSAGGEDEKSESEKKKDEEEKKKKEKEEEDKKKEDAEKNKEAATGEVDITQRRVAQKTEKILQTSSKIERTYGASKNEKHRETTEKMKGIGGKLKKLNKEDAENQEVIKSQLDKLISEGKISKEKAQEIMDMDPTEGDFEDKWSSLIAAVPDLKKNAPVAVERIKELKKEEAEKSKKLEEEYAKVVKEFQEISREMRDDVMNEAQRQRALKMLSSMSGLPIDPQQKLVALGLHEDPKTKELVKSKKYYEIKKIDFEEIEIEDDDGKVIKKIKTNSPVVTVESQNPITNKIEQDQMTAGQLYKWVDEIGVTEDIQSLNELHKSIGEKVKAGDVFEYRELMEPETGKFSSEDQTVKIKRIDEVLNEIELDERVKIGGKKEKKLSFGDFAKWFKRSEVLRPIENLKKLRNELIIYNEAMNTVHKRPPGHYPPIKGIEGEALSYDDDSGRMFVIKKISDKGVEFDNGEKFTLAAFLRWVKRNMVERRDPEAEAKRTVQNHQEGKEKKDDFEKAKKRAEEQIEDHKDQAKDPEHAKGLPHSDEPSNPPASYLRRLWGDTELLSLGDMWEFGHTIIEFIKRKLKRWQHGRVGRFGEQVFKTIGKPFSSIGGIGEAFATELGAEFKGVAQHAENEEVNHHVQHYETMGIETVKHELHKAPNTDILKAAVTALCKKGQMRWDDEAFWACVNRLSNGIPRFITRKNHLEDIQAVFDYWWGQNTYLEFKNNQDSQYNSARNSFKDNAQRLESDPGGLRNKLKSLTWQYLSGEYVNPAEYEEYIHFAIDNGKMGFEDKLYYLIMGVGAEPYDEHGHGMPLMHLDRVGAIESELLNKFPVLDYFTSQEMPAYDNHGHPIPGETRKKANIGNFKHWINDMLLADLNDQLSAKGHASINSMSQMKDLPHDIIECIGPGPRFKKFVSEVMMWSDSTLIRLNKASRDATNWDHDDMDFFAPHLSEDQVDKICRYAGSARQQVSTPGLLNAAMGFNDALHIKFKMLQEHLKDGDKEEASKDLRHITDMLKSQIRYQAICDGRFDANNNNLSRLGPSEQRLKALNDGDANSKTVKQHFREVQTFIENLAKEFGMMHEYHEVYKEYPGKVGADIASKQDGFIKEFTKRLEGEIAKRTKEGDDPTAALKIFEAAGYKHVTGRGVSSGEKKEFKELPPDRRLQTYSDPELEGLIEKYKAAKEALAQPTETRTKEQVRLENEKRATEIIDDYESKTYTPRPDDKKVLTSEITRLTAIRDPEAAKELNKKPAKKEEPTPVPDDFD